MKKIAHTVLFLAFAISFAHAGSTIDPTQPKQNSELNSSVVRGNFAAAYNDINNLSSGYAGANAPTNPTVGQFWRKTNVSPQIIYQWSGSAWLPYSTFDIANSRVTPAFGNPLLAWQQLLTGPSGLGTLGQCLTSTGPGSVPTAQNCVSATTLNASIPLSWNSGTLTLSLNYGSDFVLSGSNLVLSSIIAGQTQGSGTNTPVITVDAKGRVTALSNTTISPPFTAITGQATLSQLPQLPASTVIGNASGVTSGSAALTTAQLTSMVNLATGALSGSVPAWPNDPTLFFNGTGNYAAVPFTSITGSLSCAQMPALTGNVTTSAGACATTIGAGVVTNSMLAGSIAASKLIGTDIATVGTVTAGTWNATSVTPGYGGTGQSSYVLGDLLYASGTTTLSKLSGNTTTAKRYLSQTGTGVVSAVPAWADIAGVDVSGAALTKTDDTNVTLTLGGSASTALLRSASITVGWVGTLAPGRGGFGADISAQSGVPLFTTGVPTFTGTSGTGNFARVTSPVFTTPNLGTPSAVTLTNGTGLPTTGLTGTLQAAQFPALTGDVTTSAGSLTTAIGTNKVVNSMLAQAGAATLKGNPTGSTANASDFTIQGLTARGAPDASNDKLMIYDNAAGTIKYVTPSQIAGASSGTVTSITAGTALTGGTITTSGTIAIDKASSSNYFAGTSNKVPTTDVIYTSEVTVTYGATTTFDFSTFINSSVTLTGNITTMTFSNVIAGKAGSIRFIQDGTGSRTTVWNSILKWAGGNAPTLSTAANAVDVLNYNCLTTTFCQAALVKDVK